MRPQVLAKTMTNELILLCFSITAVIALPLYFLKIRPMQLEAQEKTQQVMDSKLEREADKWIQDGVEYAK